MTFCWVWSVGLHFNFHGVYESPGLCAFAVVYLYKAPACQLFYWSYVFWYLGDTWPGSCCKPWFWRHHSIKSGGRETFKMYQSLVTAHHAANQRIWQVSMDLGNEWSWRNGFQTIFEIVIVVFIYTLLYLADMDKGCVHLCAFVKIPCYICMAAVITLCTKYCI